MKLFCSPETKCRSISNFKLASEADLVMIVITSIYVYWCRRRLQYEASVSEGYHQFMFLHVVLKSLGNWSQSLVRKFRSYFIRHFRAFHSNMTLWEAVTVLVSFGFHPRGLWSERNWLEKEGAAKARGDWIWALNVWDFEVNLRSNIQGCFSRTC